MGESLSAFDKLITLTRVITLSIDLSRGFDCISYEKSKIAKALNNSFYFRLFITKSKKNLDAFDEKCFCEIFISKLTATLLPPKLNFLIKLKSRSENFFFFLRCHERYLKRDNFIEKY